jgi:hypothetical protein
MVEATGQSERRDDRSDADGPRRSAAANHLYRLRKSRAGGNRRGAAGLYWHGRRDTLLLYRAIPQSMVEVPTSSQARPRHRAPDPNRVPRLPGLTSRRPPACDLVGMSGSAHWDRRLGSTHWGRYTGRKRHPPLWLPSRRLRDSEYAAQRRCRNAG